MEFCEECDALLTPKRVDGQVVMFCPDCEQVRDAEVTTIKQSVDREKDPEGGKMLVVEEGDGRTVGRPSTLIHCPRCDEKTDTEYWEIQTRSADESPTRFFKCLVCSKQWREYD
jgi:transcription factor S